jgi:hypothetical protein
MYQALESLYFFSPALGNIAWGAVYPGQSVRLVAAALLFTENCEHTVVIISDERLELEHLRAHGASFSGALSAQGLFLLERLKPF